MIPYGPIQLDPSAIVLHYAQEVFEGLKAYRWADGSIVSFRPDANAAHTVDFHELVGYAPLEAFQVDFACHNPRLLG